ncbi:hypothetical protein ASG89_02730 [Paenibacillus sp. Soil766]|uniref:hypothetical protein n=1 Tax=Paenibacillus sp. Soil766 TaxID=1736404 RepID=UPI00070EE465|nr:hypothetical protein [Paenibacillus sp. Soil766]KRF03692.1 hypothetical protein ASG89_02730 [Paenibacillus sp. Soil766]
MTGLLDKYAFDLRKSVAPPGHIGVTSLYSVTAPQYGTVTGVKGFFSPPYAASELLMQLQFTADGMPVEDTGNLGKEDCGLLLAGAVWQPDRILRRGTYHWLKEGKMYSLDVNSDLVPLTGRAGYVLAVRVTNRCGRTIPLSIVPQLNPGLVNQVPLGEWGFCPPRGGVAATNIDHHIWKTDTVRIMMLHEQLTAEMLPGEEVVFRFAVVFTAAGCDVTMPGSLAEWEQETSDSWTKRIAHAEATVPQLQSDIPGLEAYYRRSLISGLICMWEHPDFKIQPFLAVSGIDGGGISCYPWDTAGYVGQTLTMLLGPEKSADFLTFMYEGGIDRHICFFPDGTGDQPFPYSYSLWSFFHFAWSTFCQHGAVKELYPMLERILEVDEERLMHHGELLDYGNHHHLLEMRSSGFEHAVASPNAERAWCYDRMGELADHFGFEGASAWREKAAGIRKGIQEQLWDRSQAWFGSLYPDGHKEYIYSIQYYDSLRMGVCTPEMEQALLSHLRDGAFLGEYGVSSISAEDSLHYELNDPDWSGGGSFAGEGAILAQTLWEIGQSELAWDVMKRHIWMGKHLPYFPQEHYCDRPQTPAHKRANNIAGMAGAQALIMGMAGIRPQLDGSLLVHPQPLAEGHVSIIGYLHRGKRIDVHVEPGSCRIVCAGEDIYSGVPSLQRVV